MTDPADPGAVVPAEGDAGQLLEHAPCGVVSTAADGTVLRVNATLLRWLGYERADVVGRRRFEDLLAPGPRVLWLTHSVPALAAGGSVGGLALDLVRVDGERLPVLVGAELLTGAGGGPPRVLVTLSDARERRAYEARLVAARAAAERSEQRARALQAVTSACAVATTTEQLLSTVTSAAAGAWSACGAALWVADGDGPLRLAAATGTAEQVVPREVAAAQSGPFALAWTGGRVVAVESPEQMAQSAPQLRAAAARAGVEAVLVVPVGDGDGRAGVLALLLPASRPVAAEEVSVLATVGQLVGQALSRTRLHARLHEQALHDGLTGLANRVLLTDRLRQALARSARTGAPLALLMLDLDGFKAVNDRLGHAAGDALLVQCGQRLRDAVRDGDTVARLGGDEFVVLCEDADAVAAAAAAERVRTLLSQPVDVAGTVVTVGASLGVVVRDVPADGDDPAGLLAEADAAMYRAKRRPAPVGTVTVASAGRVENLLRRAVGSGGLELHYAPVFDLAEQRAVAFEALVRLTTGGGAGLPPAAFLPVADSCGLLPELGALVLDGACRQLAAWVAEGLPEVAVVVNLGPAQLDGDLARTVLAAVAAAGCPAELLTVAVPETALQSASGGGLGSLSALREAGIGVQVDGFGGAAGALRLLQSLPVTEVEVDRSVVAGLPSRRGDVAIVRAVARLAQELEIACVAEGVETPEQLELLRPLGVRASGFLLGRPVPAAAAVEHLRRTPSWAGAR